MEKLFSPVRIADGNLIEAPVRLPTPRVSSTSRASFTSEETPVVIEGKVVRPSVPNELTPETTVTASHEDDNFFFESFVPDEDTPAKRPGKTREVLAKVGRNINPSHLSYWALAAAQSRLKPRPAVAETKEFALRDMTNILAIGAAALRIGRSYFEHKGMAAPSSHHGPTAADLMQEILAEKQSGQSVGPVEAATSSHTDEPLATAAPETTPSDDTERQEPITLGDDPESRYPIPPAAASAQPPIELNRSPEANIPPQALIAEAEPFPSSIEERDTMPNDPTGPERAIPAEEPSKPIIVEKGENLTKIARELLREEGVKPTERKVEAVIKALVRENEISNRHEIDIDQRLKHTTADDLINKWKGETAAPAPHPSLDPEKLPAAPTMTPEATTISSGATWDDMFNQMHVPDAWQDDMIAALEKDKRSSQILYYGPEGDPRVNMPPTHRLPEFAQDIFVAEYDRLLREAKASA